MAEDRKSSPKSDSRSQRNQKSITSNIILKAISQFRGDVEMAAAAEDGRMKIVVRKDDLKQALEAIRDGWRPASLERRGQVLRNAIQVKGRSGQGTWRPALHSIPEEL